MSSMQFGVVSLLPEIFSGWMGNGVIGRAIRDEVLDIAFANPRDYAVDNYGHVDDTPYGGGPGMVMQIPMLLQSVNQLRQQMPQARVCLLAPQGEVFSAQTLPSWQAHQAHIFVCGRYEGIDQRFIEHVQPHICSIGDFVLCGGELAAMTIIETLARHLPGVLGNAQSARQDSFVEPQLDHPHYTRPESYQGMHVPEVLRGGNHKRIAAWRSEQACIDSWEYRPDLFREHSSFSKEQMEVLSRHYAAKNSTYFAAKEQKS